VDGAPDDAARTGILRVATLTGLAAVCVDLPRRGCLIVTTGALSVAAPCPHGGWS